MNSLRGCRTDGSEGRTLRCHSPSNARRRPPGPEPGFRGIAPSTRPRSARSTCNRFGGVTAQRGHATVCAGTSSDLWQSVPRLRNEEPGRWAKNRGSRSSWLSTAARSCRIDSAPPGRFQCFCSLFTRALTSPTSDSTKLLVVGNPSRRYRGYAMRSRLFPQ
ncbi:hypothetical protein FTUN_4535 [Frigoriglobus tundricola]|uniref:Uncharacterized protein n=1 Tax=Frigoriglobus tundricola TaxID=2774151 RepID=A0A6M5YSE7_9BACT|nr:hypothetical protein FTUN_4535 [Frigoriglobus tundricola]